VRALSATSLKTYRRCPRQWKFRYVEKAKEEDKPFFNLGTAVHAALETFHDGRVAAPAASVEEMLEAFAEAFEPEPGGHGRWCDFRPLCPAFADEFPENWEEAAEPEGGEGG